MGYDCGFDIHPKLSVKTDCDAYERFKARILDEYEDAFDDDSRRKDGKLLEIPWEADCRDKQNITFMIGECPQIPYLAEHCEYFLRFSSKVSGAISAPAEPYIKEVCKIAKEYFGERVHFWHELRDTGDERSNGYYNWQEIRDARDKMNEAAEKSKQPAVNKLDTTTAETVAGH